MRAGRFFVHGSHDRAQRRAGDLAIEIEAGLAFGTGHHGTTAGCLEMIETVVRREHPRNALDLGTGSAVLAIAVAKLAHIPVLATDIDPVATRVAAAECRGSTASRRYVRDARPRRASIIRSSRRARAVRPDRRQHPGAAADAAGAGHGAASSRSGGSLILSGILDRQRNAVLAAYVGQSFRHVRTLAPRGLGDAPPEALRSAQTRVG